MAEQTYLSKQKAARRLDVSEKTIDRLRSSGALEWINVGSRVPIPLASLQAYEQRQQGREPQQAEPQRERLGIPALDAIRAAKAARHRHPAGRRWRRRGGTSERRRRHRHRPRQRGERGAAQARAGGRGG